MKKTLPHTRRMTERKWIKLEFGLVAFTVDRLIEDEHTKTKTKNE